MNAENTADIPTTRDSERVDRDPTELTDERIKANLEPPNEQISTLTQLLNQLIQKTRHVTPQRRVLVLIRHSPSGEVGTSRTRSEIASGRTVFTPESDSNTLEKESNPYAVSSKLSLIKAIDFLISFINFYFGCKLWPTERKRGSFVASKTTIEEQKHFRKKC